MDSSQSAFSSFKCLECQASLWFGCIMSPKSILWLFSLIHFVTVYKPYLNNGWPNTTSRPFNILLVCGWQACGVQVRVLGHVYLDRSNIWKRITLGRFWWDCRSILLCCSWVPPWVCSFRWLYCYCGLCGTFIHHIKMPCLHQKYIHKDLYPYLWVREYIPQEVLRKH